MSDVISLSEKRMYGRTHTETHAYVASGLGVTRVETAGGQIGRFSLARRCAARDIAGAGGEIAVATEESVLVSTDDGFAETGFGPATTVGYDADGLVAAGEGRIARYDDGEWWGMGAVDGVRALSGDLVAAADGVYGLPGCPYLGLHAAADVAGPFAATADGLYRRDAEGGPVGPDTLYGLTDTDGASPDPHWRPCDLPVRERVVDVAYGTDTYAITEDATCLVNTADDATADGRGGWRGRSLGVPEVVGIAVA